jgi:DNA-directed RNA polymerase subunit alpha
MVEIDLNGLVLPERVETQEKSEDGTLARFSIGPLERGFGHTLGNSVRRVLLSSLRGSAVWAFRIDGVVHEHQTIDGVVEDVHQVIQNLKSLVVSLDEDSDDAVLTVQVKKAGPVTAAHVKAPPTVTLQDPGHHILTLQEDRELNMEFHVNKGRGFTLADQHAVPRGAPVDLVRIDAIYNPVRRANFSVEETRVGQRTDFDRLTLMVETDGSLSPEGAVAYAAELVRKHLEY